MLQRCLSLAALVFLLAGCTTLGTGPAGRPHPGAGSETPAPAAVPRTAAGEFPRLVLQITVDQLRGDLPWRYADRFGTGGFRYLLDRGAWYAAAYHPHAHTETLVGHSTLATGAFPSRHGMIGDSWYDRDARETQSIVDSQTPIVGTTTAGGSPVEILTTTFSDELAITTASGAKVFAVSVKDRAAVPMAGHTGKAFWFSTDNGSFVSSTYYYASYPEWVTAWNAAGHADRFLGQSWTPLYPPSTYLFGEADFPADSRAGQAMALLDQYGFGSSFPHAFAPKPMFYTTLTMSPVGDQLTLEFAMELIEQEMLGTDDVPDYLGISFSSTDIVGHWFGPETIESEDTILQLDRTLARLFAFIDERVGLDRTLIVLAGDHGAPDVPEYLESLGINSGRLPENLVQDTAAQALDAQFNGGSNFILSYSQPYLYLDLAAIEEQNLEPVDLERCVAEAVMQIEGVALAVPRSELEQGGEEDDADLIAKIRRNQHPKRSGDVYVVQEPQWQIDEEEPPSGEPFVIMNHGSPWAYDTYVPVVFAGAGVPAARISRPIWTVDVAATLAARFKTKFPSGSVGVPLVEVLGQPSSGTAR